MFCSFQSSASGMPMLTQWLFPVHPKVYPSTCSLDGGKQSYRSKAKKVAIHAAAEQGQRRRVSMLLWLGKDPDRCNACGVTALHIAAWRDHCRVVRTLVKHGCDVNKVDRVGHNALSKAAWKGCADCVRTLLHAGSTVDVRDNSGNTPLLLACELGHETVVSLLMAAGADFNSQNRRGESPLHLATSHSHVTCVQTLLRAGADPNLTMCDGCTPASTAAKLTHCPTTLKILQLLLSANCDPEIRGTLVDVSKSYNKTPIEVAFHKRHLPVAILLYMCGSDASGILDTFQHSEKSPEWLEFWRTISAPRSLKDLSRIQIRNSIRGICKPRELPLPQTIISYINLCDVMDVDVFLY